MLAIIGSNDHVDGELRIDSYVPFSFRAGRSIRANPITWRYTDDDQGLFELKIDRKTGEIYGVTLVDSILPIDRRDELPCSNFGAEHGLPLVDVQNIRGTSFDERISARLIRTKHSFGIFWGNWASITRSLSVERVRFLVSEDDLVGVCFVDLTSEDGRYIDEWSSSRDLIQ